MNVFFNTGYNFLGPRLDAIMESRNNRIGGTVKILAANIKRFLNLYESRKDIFLRVCTTKTLWKTLVNLFPFVNHPSIIFLDFNEVLKKQKLQNNIYWYDALRFQVLSTIEECEDSLEYWVDADTLIQREDLVEVCIENSKSIIAPRCFVPWSVKDYLELQKFQKIFSIFDLDIRNIGDWDYTNTGTLFGGPSKNIKLVSSKILELERAFERPVDPPSSPVLEYVSCVSPERICKNLGISFARVDDNLVYHLTGGHGIPLGIVTERDLEENFDRLSDSSKNRVLEVMRTSLGEKFIQKIYSEILESKEQTSNRWKELLILAYKDVTKPKPTKTILI